MQDFLELAVGAAAAGCIYGLLALAYLVMIRPTGIINFAVGEWAMVGAFAGFLLLTEWHWPYALGMAAILVFMLVVGWATERVAVRPLLERSAPVLAPILALLGMLVVFRESISLVFGPDPHQVPYPFGFGRLEFGPLAGSYQSFFMIGVSAGVLTAENVLMLKAYRQMGMKMPILASYNFSVPVYMSVAQGLLDGVAFVDAYDLDKPAVKQFVAAYKKANGKDPYNLHGYGYDGMHLVVDAIKRAGSTDKEKIREAMQATKGLHGVMGSKDAAYGFAEGKRTGFDPNGMVVRVYEGDKQGRVVHVGLK